jgi:hypothetical protein
MSNITNVGSEGRIPGKIISASCNITSAVDSIVDYLDSTYNLQAADTQLTAVISNEEAQVVSQFEQEQNSATGPNNYIYQLEQLEIMPPIIDNSSKISELTTLYTEASAENQAEVKVMDGNNSTAQNTLNQNSQGQQGLIQTLGSINSVASNLVRILQG